MGKEKVRQRVALGSDKTSAKKKTVSKSPKETEEEKKKREEEEDEEFEKQCEKYCSYVITLAMIASPLYGLVTFVGEYVTRSPMVADVADLSQQKIVITGGCDGMGAELARMMVDSGGSVTLGCRDMDRAEDAVRQIQLGSKDPAAARSAVVARQLDLESFESVREFATQYNDENDRLDVLILNAGTTVGCNMTVDDQEMAFQVNYLGHYLLSDLLLPKIKGSSRNLAERETGRIVSVTCPAAKDGAIVLENIPPIVEDFETCSPSKEYANSKLAQIVFSNELERRLRQSIGGNGVVSLAVDPQEVSTRFMEKGPEMTATGRVSLKSRMLMMFPPFRLIAWMFGGVKNVITGAMKRSVNHGASAIYHVATAKSLAKSGGHLYSDRAGPFVHCGQKVARCGRVNDIPDAVSDASLRQSLWKKSAQLVKQYSSQLDSSKEETSGIASTTTTSRPRRAWADPGAGYDDLGDTSGGVDNMDDLHNRVETEDDEDDFME